MMNRGAVFDRLEMLINICDNFRLRRIWELPQDVSDAVSTNSSAR
jgi:hypothetical protein